MLSDDELVLVETAADDLRLKRDLVKLLPSSDDMVDEASEAADLADDRPSSEPASDDVSDDEGDFGEREKILESRRRVE